MSLTRCFLDVDPVQIPFRATGTAQSRTRYAVVFVVGLFTYLVADSIDGAGEMIETKESMPFHSISIRIVSSYLQVAGMLMSFDLTLPASVRGLIMVEASTSS